MAASEDEGEDEGEDGWGEDASGSIDPLEPALCMLDAVLLKRWPRDAPLPEAAHVELLPRLLRVVASATEPEVVRLGSTCLSRFLRRGALPRSAAATGGGAAIAAAGGAADGAAGAWLACFSRLLRPSLPEAAALYVPPLVALALRHAPWLFAPRSGGGGGGGGEGGGEGGGGLAAHALGTAVGWLRSARLFGLQQARPRWPVE